MIFKYSFLFSYVYFHLVTNETFRDKCWILKAEVLFWRSDPDASCCLQANLTAWVKFRRVQNVAFRERRESWSSGTTRTRLKEPNWTFSPEPWRTHSRCLLGPGKARENRNFSGAFPFSGRWEFGLHFSSSCRTFPAALPGSLVDLKF